MVTLAAGAAAWLLLTVRMERTLDALYTVEVSAPAALMPAAARSVIVTLTATRVALDAHAHARLEGHRRPDDEEARARERSTAAVLDETRARLAKAIEELAGLV